MVAASWAGGDGALIDVALKLPTICDGSSITSPGSYVD